MRGNLPFAIFLKDSNGSDEKCCIELLTTCATNHGFAELK